MMLPPLVVLRRLEVTPVMAKVEVVAFWRILLPRRVVEESCAVLTAVKMPPMVVEAETERAKTVVSRDLSI